VPRANIQNRLVPNAELEGVVRFLLQQFEAFEAVDPLAVGELMGVEPLDRSRVLGGCNAHALRLDWSAISTPASSVGCKRRRWSWCRSAPGGSRCSPCRST